MGTRKWIGAGVFVAILAGVLVANPSMFRDNRPYYDGTCRPVALAAGAGDITIDSQRGIAYVAYLDRTPNPEGKTARGTVMLVDLNATEPRVRAALVTDPPEFRPVALSLFAPARRLFVVGSGSPASIHLFEQASTGAFALVRSVSDPLLVNPTSVVAAGPNQFYATTDVGWRDPGATSWLSRWWRLAFSPSLSTVVFYDGQKLREVAGALTSAAGIDMSVDGKTIYVSEMGAKRLRLYTRDSLTGALTSQGSVKLPSLPSSVHVDARGFAWVAAYPSINVALKALAGRQAKIPSEVLRVSTGDSQAMSFFRDGGTQIAGASTASAYGKDLVIGASADRKLLLCRSTR